MLKSLFGIKLGPKIEETNKLTSTNLDCKIIEVDKFLELDLSKSYKNYFPKNNAEQTIFEANQKIFNKLKKMKKGNLFLNLESCNSSNLKSSKIIKNQCPLKKRGQITEELKEVFRKEATRKKLKKKEKCNAVKKLINRFINFFRIQTSIKK